jgi:rhodanese-related sulfurtransferase
VIAGSGDALLHLRQHAVQPINFAGMIAANHLRGDDPIIHWKSQQLATFDLLDVRDPDEFAEGHASGARNLSLNTLRSVLGELSKERPLAVYCAVGARAYNAVRLGTSPVAYRAPIQAPATGSRGQYQPDDVIPTGPLRYHGREGDGV